MTIISTTKRNLVALIVNKTVWNVVLGCTLTNNKMILVHFQGKRFNTTIIQVYAPPTDDEKAELDQFYKDLQHLLELISRKDAFFIIGNAKVEG